MIFIQIDAEYNPVTEKLEIQLPAGLDPADVTIKRHKHYADDYIPTEAPTWTETELDEIFKTPEHPMTGAELVRWIEMEGGWEDLQITSGAEWSIEQRKKIEGRYKW